MAVHGFNGRFSSGFILDADPTLACSFASVVSDAVTSTSASTVQQHGSVQLYNDVRVGVGGVSQASSLSAVELPPSAIYRSSVIYQQVLRSLFTLSIRNCDRLVTNPLETVDFVYI